MLFIFCRENNASELFFFFMQIMLVNIPMVYFKGNLCVVTLAVKERNC